MKTPQGSTAPELQTPMTDEIDTMTRNGSKSGSDHEHEVSKETVMGRLRPEKISVRRETRPGFVLYTAQYEDVCSHGLSEKEARETLKKTWADRQAFESTWEKRHADAKVEPRAPKPRQR